MDELWGMDDMDARLQELKLRIQAGDQSALGPIFELFRQRLRTVIRMRFNSRVRRREDESDILQESYFAAANDLPRYAKKPKVPIYVWLRGIVQQRLVDAHRKHLHCQKRSLDQEISINRTPWPETDSSSVANQLVSDLGTPSFLASNEELWLTLQTIMEELDPIDREIIALRHLEGLKSSEVAAVLEINQSTASTRYLRALKKLKDGLEGAA